MGKLNLLLMSLSSLLSWRHHLSADRYDFDAGLYLVIIQAIFRLPPEAEFFT